MSKEHADHSLCSQVYLEIIPLRCEPFVDVCSRRLLVDVVVRKPLAMFPAGGTSGYDFKYLKMLVHVQSCIHSSWHVPGGGSLRKRLAWGCDSACAFGFSILFVQNQVRPLGSCSALTLCWRGLPRSRSFIVVLHVLSSGSQPLCHRRQPRRAVWTCKPEVVAVVTTTAAVAAL